MMTEHALKTVGQSAQALLQGGVFERPSPREVADQLRLPMRGPIHFSSGLDLTGDTRRRSLPPWWHAGSRSWSPMGWGWAPGGSVQFLNRLAAGQALIDAA